MATILFLLYHTHHVLFSGVEDPRGVSCGPWGGAFPHLVLWCKHMDAFSSVLTDSGWRTLTAVLSAKLIAPVEGDEYHILKQTASGYIHVALQIHLAMWRQTTDLAPFEAIN